MIKGLREELVRRNGEKKIYEYPVKHIEGSKYEVPELGFTFDAETGETNKKQGIGKGFAKIGETFKNAGRQITYTLIVEEEQQEETKDENPTTLVEEWKHEDGTVETHEEYTGRIWEKGNQRRLYLDNHNKGAYVDLNNGTFHPDRMKSRKVGEWIQEWNAKVEYRYVLR